MKYTKGKKQKKQKQKPKRLHILAGLSQEIATCPTFMVGCPAQPHENSCHKTFSPAHSFSLRYVELSS